MFGRSNPAIHSTYTEHQESLTTSVSEAPTYHSRQSTEQPPPSYTPRERTQARSRRQHQQPAQQQTIGLPPIPPAPTPGVPSLHNFNIPTWSTRNAQSANQLHRVIERRVLAEAASSSINSRPGTPRRGNSVVMEEEHTVRPLEDPYLVGEEAAAQAKRERLARERDDSILQMEEKQWDWLLSMSLFLGPLKGVY